MAYALVQKLNQLKTIIYYKWLFNTMLRMSTSNTVSCILLILMINIFTTNAASIGRLQSVEDKITKRQTQSYQCSAGTTGFNSTLATTFRAQQGVIYIDKSRPVSCSGRVTSIEVCFVVNVEISGEYAIDLAVLRPDGDTYRVEESQELRMNPIPENDDQSETNVLICQNITMTNTLTVSEGDFIGFVCRSSIEVAFTIFPEEGAPKSATIQPALGVERVREDQLSLAGRNDFELPMFRALIVDDGSGSLSTTPPSNNCPTGGSDNNGGGGGGGRVPELNTNNIYNTAFTSFVVATIVAIIIIFFLILIICGMGMSLCKMKFKILYNILCCCCKKKKKKGIIRKIMHV